MRSKYIFVIGGKLDHSLDHGMKENYLITFLIRLTSTISANETCPCLVRVRA